jgi:hypothetical protein
MAGRRSAICFGVFLGTTQLSSRRQCSQVARQAALSIMANTVVAFNAPRREFLFVLAGIPYQYRYWYWYWYARGGHVSTSMQQWILTSLQPTLCATANAAGATGAVA